MTFNVQAGNNDEFMGNLPRTQIGTFCYTTRYSGDGGNTWYYAVNGPDESNTTCPGPFGVMTITTGNDTTAPAAPTTLAISGVTSASISLTGTRTPTPTAISTPSASIAARSAAPTARSPRSSIRPPRATWTRA